MITDKMLGAALRRIRVREGLSIRELAEMVGSNKHSWRQREVGETTLTAVELLAFCAALRLQAEDVLDEAIGKRTVKASPIQDDLDRVTKELERVQAELADVRARGYQPPPW